MRNLHKFYYKDYFSEDIKGVDKDGDKLSFEHLYLKEGKERERDNNIEKKNELILKSRNSEITGTKYVKKESGKPTRELLQDAEINLDKAIEYKPFNLDVQYPGLVTGIGIDHETKITGEFKLGVHFDWTHGMPVIYGSSVKGVLRAWFKDTYKNSQNKYYDCGIDEDDLLIDIFSGKTRDKEAEKKRCEEEWNKMTASGAIVYEPDKKKKHQEEWEKKMKEVKNRIYRPKSIYDRDIFFDAVIVKADHKGRILCSDSITPHGDNPLKNPKPITFLKIAPGCKLEFRFRLHNSIYGDGKKFTAKQKMELFKEILTTVGIGAKTNVGYGQLKASDGQ